MWVVCLLKGGNFISYQFILILKYWSCYGLCGQQVGLCYLAWPCSNLTPEGREVQCIAYVKNSKEMPFISMEFILTADQQFPAYKQTQMNIYNTCARELRSLKIKCNGIIWIISTRNGATVCISWKNNHHKVQGCSNTNNSIARCRFYEICFF